MDFKKTLTQGALRLLENPRVRKLAQDPRVWQGITAAWNAKGELTRNFDDTARRLAKELGLATPSEIRELKRTIETLEDELRRAREREDAAAAGAPVRKAPAKAKRPKAAKKKKATTGESDAPTGQSPRRRARRAADPGTEPPPE